MTTANKHAEPCPGLPAVEGCDTRRAGLISPRGFYAADPTGHADFVAIALTAGARFTDAMALNDLRYIEDCRRMGRRLPAEDTDTDTDCMPSEGFLAARWRWSTKKARTLLLDRLLWADHNHFDNPIPRRARKGGRRSTVGLCVLPRKCQGSAGEVSGKCDGSFQPAFCNTEEVPRKCRGSVGEVSRGGGLRALPQITTHTPIVSGVVSPPVHEPLAPEPPPPPAPPPANPSPPEPEPEVSSDAGSATGGEPLGGAWSGRRVVRSWHAAYQQVHGETGPLGRRGRTIAATLAGKLNARLTQPTAAQLVAGMADYLQHQAAGQAFPWLRREPHATRPAIGHFAGDENLSRFFPDTPPAWTGQEWDWTGQDGAGEPEPDPDPPAVVWTPEALAMRERVLELVRRQREADGEPQGMAAK